MEIIKKGKNPDDKNYISQCQKCGTQVKFKRHEAKLTPDQRDGDILTVDCPVCDGNIHADAYY